MRVVDTLLLAVRVMLLPAQVTGEAGAMTMEGLALSVTAYALDVLEQLLPVTVTV